MLQRRSHFTLHLKKQNWELERLLHFLFLSFLFNLLFVGLLLTKTQKSTLKYRKDVLVVQYYRKMRHRKWEVVLLIFSPEDMSFIIFDQLLNLSSLELQFSLLFPK